MAIYQEAKCKLCRREGKKLFLKGEKCFSAKCPVEKRNNVPPGQHGAKKGRLTDYGTMLREKQALKRSYAILEKQFKKHYNEAERRNGPTGELLLQILESRLDNVVYRMGLAASRSEARQLVSHKGVTVNNKMVNIPSYEVRIGDVVSVAEKAKQQLRVTSATKCVADRSLPEWIEVNLTACEGTLKALPQRSELPQDIQEHLVVELYSK